MSIKRRASGVTLIELVIFIVVISIAVVGILGVMSMTTAASADPIRRKQALMIAESLLEEVQLAQITVCDPASPDANPATNAFECAVAENWGPEAGNTRPFDNINDYVTGSGVASNIFMSGANVTDANGASFNVNGYTASLKVTAAALGAIPANGAALRITVTVTYDAGQSVILDGYRTRYAP